MQPFRRAQGPASAHVTDARGDSSRRTAGKAPSLLSHPAAEGTPPLGQVSFGDLRRTLPIEQAFGLSRGPCIDRFYIEGFLERHAKVVRGRVLEVAEDQYTQRFGGNRVTRSDVLHLTGSRRATIVADLTRGENLPDDAFDCILLTQTLQHIYDGRSAVRTLHRILAPGGTLLVSVPGISQISRYDMERWGDFWRFTSLSLRRLLEESFPPEEVEVEAFGNVLAATAFLHGLVVGDIGEGELGVRDPDYEMLLCARARKAVDP